MALKVDEAAALAQRVMRTGDQDLARVVIDGDDAIDEMLVSLTERCHDLLVRQAPVAADFRVIISVLRIIGDLERMGDLCLRIVKLAPEQPLIASNAHTFSTLLKMGEVASTLFRMAHRAFSTEDILLARDLEERDEAMDAHYSDLLSDVMLLKGANAVPLAIQTVAAGRAWERIADHAVIIGERVRYMLTGSLDSISREIGP